MPQRHFLSLHNPARRHEVEITWNEAWLLDLVPCGSFDSGDISETYWVFRGDPAGDNTWQWRAPTDENKGPF